MDLGIATQEKLTPMMEQYRSVKKTLSDDTVLFFRMGDFYEMFFEDAVRAAEILNITLTGREAGKAGRVPMCGLPYHALQGYLRTLIESNFKVAICEQIGDPKATKGLLERKITRIVSPATYLEDDTGGNNFAYLTAILANGESLALAALELATGEFFVRELPRERLLSELTLIHPREVVLPKQLARDEALVNFIEQKLGASLTQYEDWVFESEEAMRQLREGFDLASDRGIEFHEHPLAVGAAGAVLYYLKDHFHSALGHVQIPTLIESKEYMVLDRQTQNSLELVHSLSGEKSAPTLLSTVDQTQTSMGGRTLYRWITHPLLKIEEIERRQQAITEWVKEREALNKLRGLLNGIKDMERTLSRLNYGVANARDLENLRLFLERIPQVKEELSSRQSPLLRDLSQRILPFPAIQKLIAAAIQDEAPLTLKEGGIIRDGYSDDLDELRQISREGKDWLLNFEKKEAERCGIKKLRIKYSQVFGYTIEVSKANLQNVPDDYVRRQTLANAERFITPELKEWDAKISGAQDKIKALEYELFDDVRHQVLAELTALQEMARAIGSLDCLASLAMTALQKEWVCPEIEDSQLLSIKGGRHPVVEAMLPAGEFIDNDTELDREHNQLAIITGPNMAGKSTYIRQLAQLVILAQIGSYVPAKSARIGIVDRVMTRIGASDDLARGESTFMVEMVEMAHILTKASDRSLLVLDEVGRGTSTFDGVSIAWAICERLAAGAVRPRTLFATHYHELTQLEDHFPGIKNYHITVRETSDGIIFLRKVVLGGSDRSYGIHVARLAGIPEAVTKRADEILKILESENTQATQIIEGLQEKPERSPSNQANLFEWAPREHPVLEELEKLNINEMTPIEALSRLAKLKDQLV